MRRTLLSVLASLAALGVPSSAFAQDGPARNAGELLLQQSRNLDDLWVLVCAGAVFFMQAGFLAFEVGVVRPKAAASVAMKNIIDAVIMMTFFFLIGFGVMFGDSMGGLGIVGTSLFAFDPTMAVDGQLVSVFFIFQLAFACTAMTIVSGAMAERTGFIAYLAAAIIVGMVVYPVFGHWAWGNLLEVSNESWLARLGFIDFAGGTVVHSVGGWMALIGLWLLGPRLGRFDPSTGEVNELPTHENGIAWTAMGTLFLWVGWWGFNGGSTLSLNSEALVAILNTNLAAGTGGLFAFMHCHLLQNGRFLKIKVLGGVLGGLVAITASAAMVPGWAALLIGAIAGPVHNLAHDFLLDTLKLDDAVGAVPVHLACGIYGTMAAALFVAPEYLAWAPADAGSVWMARVYQLGVQAVGVLSCMAWCLVISYVMFGFLHETFGLRLSPRDELEGMSYGDRQSGSDVDADELRKILEG
ncbi:MAG: ammonium transporter [Myxococcales bacterium]|nr:ammonium transporter [Myxococcales bacterium]